MLNVKYVSDAKCVFNVNSDVAVKCVRHTSVINVKYSFGVKCVLNVKYELDVNFFGCKICAKCKTCVGYKMCVEYKIRFSRSMCVKCNMFPSSLQHVLEIFFAPMNFYQIYSKCSRNACMSSSKCPTFLSDFYLICSIFETLLG